jgi:hypothetical protein
MAPTIAPAPINTRPAPAPRSFQNVTSSYSSDDDDNVDGPPVAHEPFDLTDTNAPLTPQLSCKLSSFNAFYNPKPCGQGNFTLLAQPNVIPEDELLSYHYGNHPSKETILEETTEFCNAHLPDYNTNTQSAAQAVLSKRSKHWWKSMIADFLSCEEKKVWVIIPKSKVPKGWKKS